MTLPKSSNPRHQAWEILIQVLDHHAFSNLLLNEMANNDQLKPVDKNLIFNLVHGVVTWKIYLSYVVNKLIDKKKTPLPVQILLWMGVYQLRYLDGIPAYAVVNESVNLVKTINPKFAGLVNKVLKTLVEQESELYLVQEKNQDKNFCLTYAFPWKLFTLLSRDYGKKNARAVVIDSVAKPLINFRVNTLKTSVDQILNQYQEQFNLSRVVGVDDCLIATKPLVHSQLYTGGEITIQDAASVLVGQTLSPTVNSRVLDMCSAPGGKLSHLSALMQNTGVIIAYELNPQRLELIQQNLVRLGCNNVELRGQNALGAINDEPYDFILLDAPCSGFGVLKRKPEIKLNFNNSGGDFSRLVQTQAELLETAYQVLKKGGVMVYSTCTINKVENQAQIEQFLSHHLDMEVIFKQQLFGFEQATDGFFICKLMKKGKK